MRARRRTYRVELSLADSVEVVARHPLEAVEIAVSLIPRRDRERITHTRVKNAEGLIVRDWQRYTAQERQ